MTTVFRASWVLLILLLVRPAGSQTIFLHAGAADPASEGWTMHSSGPTPGAFAGAGEWVIRDTVGTPGTYRSYQRDPSPVSAQVLAAGWTLRWILRMPVVDPALHGSVQVFVKINSFGYAWYVGTRANGNAFVEVAPNPMTPSTGPQFTLAGGPGASHVYDVVWQPATATADLYVDGLLLHTGYAGWISAQSPQVFFGVLPNGPTEARFARVEFGKGTDLPVPAQGKTWGAIKAAYRGP